MIRIIGQRLPEIGNKIYTFCFFDIFVNFLDFAGCFLRGNSMKKLIIALLIVALSAGTALAAGGKNQLVACPTGSGRGLR